MYWFIIVADNAHHCLTLTRQIRNGSKKFLGLHKLFKIKSEMYLNLGLTLFNYERMNTIVVSEDNISHLQKSSSKETHKVKRAYVNDIEICMFSE